MTSSTKASLCRVCLSCCVGQQNVSPDPSRSIQSSRREETKTHVGGPARLPCPCPWISNSGEDVYDCLDTPNAVRRLCCMCSRVSAWSLHRFLFAPIRLLASMAIEHGTRSKHPVASLSKVASVVLVFLARLYESSFSIKASSACLCGRQPHWLLLRRLLCSAL